MCSLNFFPKIEARCLPIVRDKLEVGFDETSSAEVALVQSSGRESIVEAILLAKAIKAEALSAGPSF